MKQLKNYILVLDYGSDDLPIIESLLGRLRCPLTVVNSLEQAVTKTQQAPPYLVILIGNQQDWSKPLVNQFRSLTDTCVITIVALTDTHAPSWLRQEDNPGLDGFLVKPLNCDILSSLVQSAWVRQTYCSSH
jgi:AmiR/NasT family two-component response regulator